MKRISQLIYTLFAICTAMIGHTIHHSLFWSIMDFIFCPLTWCKWLVCHQVTLSIIRETFTFFLR